MYHEETVINGVLCWRGTPDGEWTQYTPEALTVALTSERARAANWQATASKLNNRLEKVRADIDG